MAASTPDAVLAGMELLRWRYQPGDWQKIFGVEIGAKRKKSRIVAGTGLTVGLGTAFGLIVLTGSPVLAGVAATVAILGAFESARSARAYIRKRREEQHRMPEAPVVFTSTGLLFDDDAWLWSGESKRLLAARVKARPWPTLILTFGGRFGREPVSIPVPRGLEDDVGELVKMLKRKLRGREGLGDLVAPRPPPDVR